MSQKPREPDERLSDWVDGRMSARDRERFEAELRVNKVLQQEAEAFRQAVTTVQQALRQDPARTDIADRVMRALQQPSTAPVAAAPTLRRLPSVRASAWVFGVLAAAALVAAVLLLQQWQPVMSPPEQQPVAKVSPAGADTPSRMRAAADDPAASGKAGGDEAGQAKAKEFEAMAPKALAPKAELRDEGLLRQGRPDGDNADDKPAAQGAVAAVRAQQPPPPSAPTEAVESADRQLQQPAAARPAPAPAHDDSSARRAGSSTADQEEADRKAQKDPSKDLKEADKATDALEPRKGAAPGAGAPEGAAAVGQELSLDKGEQAKGEQAKEMREELRAEKGRLRLLQQSALPAGPVVQTLVLTRQLEAVPPSAVAAGAAAGTEKTEKTEKKAEPGAQKPKSRGASATGVPAGNLVWLSRFVAPADQALGVGFLPAQESLGNLAITNYSLGSDALLLGNQPEQFAAMSFMQSAASPSNVVRLAVVDGRRDDVSRLVSDLGNFAAQNHLTWEMRELPAVVLDSLEKQTVAFAATRAAPDGSRDAVPQNPAAGATSEPAPTSPPPAPTSPPAAKAAEPAAARTRLAIVFRELPAKAPSPPPAEAGKR